MDLRWSLRRMPYIVQALKNPADLIVHTKPSTKLNWLLLGSAQEAATTFETPCAIPVTRINNSYSPGFMGIAILQGLLAKIKDGSGPSVHYTAWVRSQESLDRLQQALGEGQKHVKCVHGGDSVEIVAPADAVILGFPPGELTVVFENTGLARALRGKLIISLPAGVSYDKLAQSLPSDKKTDSDYHMLRVIPSIGATSTNL